MYAFTDPVVENSDQKNSDVRIARKFLS